MTHKLLANLLLGASTLAVAQTAMAESLKLVEVAAGGRTFYEQRISLDTGRAFLSADDDADGVFDVFSVSLAGDPPIILNESLSAPFNFAFPLRLSPDGSTLLYGVDGNAGLQIYSVPAVGPASASVRLDVDVAWDFDFNRTFISGDGQRVIVLGNQQDENIYELFSVPIGGPAGAIVRLNAPLLSGSVSPAVLAGDGQIMIYGADQDAAEPGAELHAVAVDGLSAPIRLSGGGSLGTSPVATQTHAVYYLDGALFSVPLAGPASAAVEISITPAVGDFIRSGLFQVTPDGQTVVYFVNVQGDNRLFSVPVVGPASAGVQLTPDGEDVREFKLAGNERVVFDQNRAAGGRELFSVPITGPSTAVVKLSPDFTLSNGGSSTYQVSPDASRVVFQGAFDDFTQSELWSVPITGPASAGMKLSPPLPPESDVSFDFVISPDSQRVAYRADLDINDVFDLYSIGIAGPTGSGVKLNGPLASGGDVCANRSDCYRFAPDSSRVVFEAEEDADNELELFIADDGRAAATFASPALTVVAGTTIALEIDLGAAAVFPVSLEITRTGGSASVDDYSLSATAVQFAPGVTRAEVLFTATFDFESSAETVELTLTNVQNAQLGLPFSTVVTIEPAEEIFVDGFESSG